MTGAGSTIKVFLILSLSMYLNEASSPPPRPERYPRQVDAEKILMDNLSAFKIYVPSEGRTNTTLPFINNRDYLFRLAQWASLSVIKSAIVVVGPRSAGKSEALKQIKPYWKELGHVVLDVDLKGQLDNVSARDVMRDLAQELTEAFYNIRDYTAKQCVFDEVYECSAENKKSWWSLLYNYRSSLYGYMNAGYTLVVTFGVGTCTLASVFHVCKDFLLQHWKKALLLSVMVLFLLVLTACIVNWYIIVEVVIHPIQNDISIGDWYTLSCCCNAISLCAPEHRPVVVVRELTNFNSESLLAFLRSLERMKQGEIHYPVLVESSDFNWAHELPVLKSSDSFMIYHLQEMMYEEGLTEVVHKFKIWTEEEYEIIYDAIRGHLGSYRVLYDYNKVQKYSLNESIWHLKRRAYNQLLETIARGSTHTDNKMKTKTEDWMLSLRQNNFNLTTAELPEEALVLFKRNILFRDSKYVYPQNKLMEHAINDYINDFLPGNQSSIG